MRNVFEKIISIGNLVCLLTSGATVVFVLLSATPAAAAENDSSGTMFYRNCMVAASIIKGNPFSDALDKAPMCFGAITAIKNIEPFLKPEFAMCPPADSKISYGQMVLVIADYLEKHPEQLHKNFYMLALVALNTAWPCTNITEKSKP